MAVNPCNDLGLALPATTLAFEMFFSNVGFGSLNLDQQFVRLRDDNARPRFKSPVGNGGRKAPLHQHRPFHNSCLQSSGDAVELPWQFLHGIVSYRFSFPGLGRAQCHEEIGVCNFVRRRREARTRCHKTSGGFLVGQSRRTDRRVLVRMVQRTWWLFYTMMVRMIGPHCPPRQPPST